MWFIVIVFVLRTACLLSNLGLMYVYKHGSNIHRGSLPTVPQRLNVYMRAHSVRIVCGRGKEEFCSRRHCRSDIVQKIRLRKLLRRRFFFFLYIYL